MSRLFCRKNKCGHSTLRGKCPMGRRQFFPFLFLMSLHIRQFTTLAGPTGTDRPSLTIKSTTMKL